MTIQHTTASVGTTAEKISDAPGLRRGRARQVIVVNSSDTAVKIGGAGVAADTGLNVAAGAERTLPVSPSPWYAILATGSTAKTINLTVIPVN